MEILGDKQYMDSVFNIIAWAQDHNEEKENHFPLLATSYGYLAVV